MTFIVIAIYFWLMITQYIFLWVICNLSVSILNVFYTGHNLISTSILNYILIYNFYSKYKYKNTLHHIILCKLYELFNNSHVLLFNNICLLFWMCLSSALNTTSFKPWPLYHYHKKCYRKIDYVLYQDKMLCTF